MNGHFGLQAWNYIFLSVALKIGQIYFTTSDMDLTLSTAHKEERWKWVVLYIRKKNIYNSLDLVNFHLCSFML